MHFNFDLKMSSSILKFNLILNQDNWIFLNSALHFIFAWFTNNVATLAHFDSLMGYCDFLSAISWISAALTKRRNKHNPTPGLKFWVGRVLFRQFECIQWWLYSFVLIWRAPHELFPKKVFPTNFQLAWKFWENSF